MAVAGHVSETRNGGDDAYLDAAWREMEEEIGLDPRDAADILVEGTLTPVGSPYFCFDGDLRRNPPFQDAEVRQIFVATLTGEGLARLQFPDEEADGIFLASVSSAWQILCDGVIASGLRYSLPRVLDWLERRGTD
jgi:8-oxo-dGTP pyrophosphatase MutT (NUDIX family)